MKSFLVLSFLLGVSAFLADAEGPEKNIQLNDGDETNSVNDEAEQDSFEDKNQNDGEYQVSKSKEDQDDDSKNLVEDELTIGKGNEAKPKPWRRGREEEREDNPFGLSIMAEDATNAVIDDVQG